MKRTVLILCTLFALVACTGNKKAEKPELLTYKIDVSKALQIRLDYLFSSRVEYIALDDKEAYIKNIDKIVLRDEDIFILDEEEHNLLRFNRQGKFLNYCGKKGRGPGELFYPADFSVTDDLIKVKTGAKNLMSFRKNGTCSGANKLPVNALSFAYLGDKIFLYRGHNRDAEKSFRMFAYDGDTLEKYLQVPEFGMQSPFQSVSKNFSRVGAYLHLHEALNDTIYQIGPNTMAPVYKIDFGKYAIPADVLQLEDEFQMMKILNKGKYANMNTYFENDTYLIFKFHLEGRGYYFFQNKQSHKSVLAKSFKNDINYFPFGDPIALTRDNKLIVKTAPYRILDREKTLYDKEVVDEQKLDAFYRLSKNMTSYSNPVVFIYQLDF